jgi:ATP-dependent RNA helicase DDX46/PRP5
MFDLGFEPQITKIIENSRPRKQVVLFSATFPKNVEMLARRILVNPCEVIVGSRGQACTNVEQIVIVLEETAKFLKLL